MNQPRFLLFLGVCLMAWGAVASPPVLAMENDIPFALQQRLEEPLQARVKSLLRERNDLDNPYKRGAFSRSFQKIDDSTYQVSFNLDTAEGGLMTTQRFLYTLKLDAAGGAWRIAGKELQDTFSGLYRRDPGDEEFRKFDSFKLELERLTVEAAGGNLIIDNCDGKPEYLILSGENLAYQFDPPGDQVGILYDVLKKEKIKDFVFTPERVTIYCDQHACAELLASSFTGLRPATRADMGNVLKNYYSEYLHNLRENRHKNGFSGFHLPYKDDRRNVTVVIKRANVDHRVGLDYDNKEPREVTFFATDYGPLFSYYSRETQNSGISSYDLEKRLDLQSRYYDLEAFKGTVELGIEESQRMRADVTFTMVTRMPLTEVRFNLARLTRGRSAS
ncbi:MAG: hypothetical protein O7F11_00310, partial [Acidobacteria bacterium]|nr:hypothetical protein [Acidobacteriota bacterium]